jgi:hypothetical protein
VLGKETISSAVVSCALGLLSLPCTVQVLAES